MFEPRDVPVEPEQQVKKTRLYVAVVGCGKRKRLTPWPAKDLYTSSGFQCARRYAENAFDHWLILSAKHRCLDPELEIEPYDQVLTTDRSKAWASSTALEIAHHLAEPEFFDLSNPNPAPWGESITIAVLASKLYGQVIEAALRERKFGGEINTEFQGLSLFGRNQLLSQLLKNPGTAETSLPKPKYGTTDIRSTEAYQKDLMTGRKINPEWKYWDVGSITIRSYPGSGGRQYDVEDREGYRRTYHDLDDAKRDAVRQANRLHRTSYSQAGPSETIS